MTKQFAALKSFNESVTLPIFLFLMAWGMVVCTYGQNVGIGTTNPQARLDVNGSFRFTNGTQGSGRILRSDATGNASWGKLQADDMLDSGATAADFSCMSAVGSVGTGTNTFPLSVAVSGNYAFVTSSYLSRLMVVDISNPAVPVLVNAGLSVAGATSIAVSGNYAFVCSRTSTNGFLVFDISNPALPEQIPNSLPVNKPYSITIAGQYAYVRGAITFYTISIINPATPVLTGSVAISEGFNSENTNSIAVSGSYAFVSNFIAGNMQVINISNPAAPAIAGSLSLTGASSIGISGDYAYVTGVPNNSPGLVAVRITSPSAPVAVDTVATGFAPINVSIAGTYLYVMASNSAILHVFDIGVANAPALVKSIGVAGSNCNFSLRDNYAYVVNASGTGNLQIIRLACAQNLALNVAGGLVGKVPQHWERLDSNLVNLNPANVGIGLNNPQAKLHVNGTTRTTNFQMTNGAGINRVLQSDASGNASWVASTSLSITEADPKVGTLTRNKIPKWNGTTLADGLILDNGTNVGIGTEQPTAKLDVSGSVRLGNQGSVMDYIRSIEEIVSTVDLGPNGMASWNIDNFPLNLSPNAAVMANPKSNLPLGVVIAWVRRTGNNNIIVQYQNTTNLTLTLPTHRVQVTAVNFQ